MIEKFWWNEPSARRRKAFTLVELLVSLSLLSLILMVLLGGYRQVVIIKKGLEENRREAFEKRYVLARLNQIFAHIPGKSPKEGQFFHTSIQERTDTSGLVFTFDNGVDLMPHFSGLILGKLYINEHHTLCLASWPMPKGSEPDYRMKHEILLDEVESLSWSFYVPPNKDLPVEGATVITSGSLEIDPPYRDDWPTAWPENYKGLPPIVKLSLKRTGKPDPQQYWFLLPSTNYIIKY